MPLRPSEYFAAETVTQARQRGLETAKTQQEMLGREQEKVGLAKAYGTELADDPYAAARGKQHIMEAVQWGGTFLGEVMTQAHTLKESDPQGATQYLQSNIQRIQELMPGEASKALNLDGLVDIRLHPSKDNVLYLKKEKGSTIDAIYDPKTQTYTGRQTIAEPGWYAITQDKQGGILHVESGVTPQAMAATGAGAAGTQYDFRKDPRMAPWVKQFEKSLDAKESLLTELRKDNKLLNLKDKSTRARMKDISYDKWQAYTNIVQEQARKAGQKVDMPFSTSVLRETVKLLEEQDIDTEALFGFEVEDYKDLIIAFDEMGMFEDVSYPYGQRQLSAEGIVEQLGTKGTIQRKETPTYFGPGQTGARRPSA